MKHVFNFKMPVVPLTSHTLKFKDMFTCFAGREPQCSASCREKDSPSASSRGRVGVFGSKFSKAEAVTPCACATAAWWGFHSEGRSNA